MTGRTVERWNAVPVPERVAERAYERVERRSDGCWISTYSVASHGYSQIGWQGNGERHIVLGHRAAYKAADVVTNAAWDAYKVASDAARAAWIADQLDTPARTIFADADAALAAYRAAYNASVEAFAAYIFVRSATRKATQ